MPLDLASAQRSRANAEVDLKHYLDVDRQLQEKSVRNSMQQSQFNLEYAAEELRQLEKMYKADELTEETEEIILTRTRREVESARFGLELNTTRGDHSLKVSIPRQKETHTENLDRQSKNLRSIVDRVRPSVESVLERDRNLDPVTLAKHAVRANIRSSVGHLRHGSEVLELLIREQGLLVVGAEYSLGTGVVEFFDGASD